MSTQRKLALALGVLCTLAYANHFFNGFHFDDWHAVQSNPHIHTLTNSFRFFVDAKTFSSLPSHQGYRPLLTFLFAVDYAAGGGLAPPAFHVDSFLCFLAVVYSLLFLALRLFGDGWRAWFITTAFALHPALAETVNYIVQRGDILAALGCVLPLYMYAKKPRILGWHLLVFVVCCFAKPSAVVFAAILFVYAFLYTEGDFQDRLIQALTVSAPAFVLAAGFYGLQAYMNPPTGETGGHDAKWYWATQPWALLHETRMFLWPNALTADTDMALVRSVWEKEFIIGTLFVVASLVFLAFSIVKSFTDARYRPIALGLAWFYITNAPTSIVPLAEVTNDHRMFAPFIGYALAVGGALAFVKEWPRRELLIAGCVALFAGEIVGTWQRNIVWRTEEALWKDVTEKSPKNGRGLMNYGLSLMSKGQLKESLEYYEAAHKLLPNYAYLETNMGIVKGALGGRDEEAERHFKRAVTLIREPIAHVFYARFLRQRQREDDAKRVLKDGLNRQSEHWELRYALLLLLEETQQYAELRGWLATTREIYPRRQELNRFFSALANGKRKADTLAKDEATLGTAERCELGRLRYMQGDNKGAIETVTPLLTAKPDEVCAIRVKALALAATGEWSYALSEAERAQTLSPAPDEYGRAMKALIGEAKLRLKRP